MRVLLDTSVLVAAIIGAHPRNEDARPWLGHALAGEHSLVIAAHTLAELHATLTTLPLKPRISPQTAHRLREDNLPADVEIVALTAEDYRVVLNRTSELGLAGGIVYDALTARAAEIAGVERLVTLNERHFHRVWPEAEDRITAP